MSAQPHTYVLYGGEDGSVPARVECYEEQDSLEPQAIIDIEYTEEGDVLITIHCHESLSAPRVKWV